jgi:hypothetical protein
VGVAAVLGGAALLVAGGNRLLGHVGLTAGFLGAAVVAPAAVARHVIRGPALAPSAPGSHAIWLRVIAGSCTGVLGAAALIRPLAVDAAASYAFLALVVVYTVLSASVLGLGRAGRLTGLLLVGLYGLWVALASTA